MFRFFCNRLFIIVLLCVLFQGCESVNKVDTTKSEQKTTESVTDEDTKSQALEAFGKGDYANAYSLYAKLLQKDPENEDLIFYYAESLRMSGNTGLALDQYNRLLAKNKNNVAAIEGRGLSFLQHGDIDKSLAEMNLVVEKDATRWRALNAMGVVYSISGKDEDAMKYYNMALSVSNNNPSVINNISLGMAFAGQSQKSIDLLKNAINTMSITGEKKQIMENNLALIYGISGKMDEAEAILRKTLPEAAVYNNLGFYAKIASDKKLAWSYLSKAESASPVFYEKASNNLQDLENPSVASKIITNPAPSNLDEGDSKKVSPVKVWRGTHKLPLPTLRP